MSARKTLFAATAASLAAAFSSGCMSMFLAGAPTGVSFPEPPVREAVESFPRETLVGTWTGASVMDMFVAGKRMMVSDISQEVVFNDDGTCSHTETHTVVESAVGAGYGHNMSQEVQIVCEGTWTYEGDLLTLDLTEGSTGLKFTWKATPRWYSDEEVLFYETDEQATENARSSGSGLGWDTRTVAANGVITYLKKGIPLLSPEQKLVASPLYLKRTADAQD